MKLRAYVDQDATATMSVFERAIRITASTDYTSEQIDAWVSTGLDGSDASAWWAAARAAAMTIVAVEDDQVVGFSDLVDGSLLDMLLVDPDVSRRGVGAALVTRIVRLARKGGAGTLETYASLTARPLFERFGFVIVERCTPVVHGIVMTNFKMRLAL
jgi:putative acetyltransferase